MCHDSPTSAAVKTRRNEKNTLTAVEIDISDKTSLAVSTDSVGRRTQTPVVGRKSRPVQRTTRSKTPPAPLITAAGCTNQLPINNSTDTRRRSAEISVSKRRSLSVGSSPSAQIIHRTISRECLEVTTTTVCCETTTIIPATSGLNSEIKTPSTPKELETMAASCNRTFVVDIDFSSFNSVQNGCITPVPVQCDDEELIPMGHVSDGSEHKIQTNYINNCVFQSQDVNKANDSSVNSRAFIGSNEHKSLSNENLEVTCFSTNAGCNSSMQVPNFQKIDPDLAEGHEAIATESLAARASHDQLETFTQHLSADCDRHGNRPTVETSSFERSIIESTMSSSNGYFLSETVDSGYLSIKFSPLDSTENCHYCPKSSEEANVNEVQLDETVVDNVDTALRSDPINCNHTVDKDLKDQQYKPRSDETRRVGERIASVHQHLVENTDQELLTVGSVRKDDEEHDEGFVCGEIMQSGLDAAEKRQTSDRTLYINEREQLSPATRTKTGRKSDKMTGKSQCPHAWALTIEIPATVNDGCWMSELVGKAQ